MSSRARGDIVLQEADGDVRANKTLTFYEIDGSTPLAQSIYTVVSGGSPVLAPAVNSLGTARYFTPNPQRAVAVPSDDPLAPFPVDFTPAPEDIILEGQSGRSLADLDITTNLDVGRWFRIEGTVTSAQIATEIAAGHLHLELGAGTHTLDTKITMVQGLQLKGQGIGATIINWTGGNNGIVFEYSAVSNPTASFITISDLTIQSATNTGVTGIKITNGGFERFSNIHFLGVKTHIYMFGGVGPTIRDISATLVNDNPSGMTWLEQVIQPNLDGFTTFRGDPDTGDAITDQPCKLRLTKIAGGIFGHLNFYAPVVHGVLVEDDCQGLKIGPGVITSCTSGVVLNEANGVAPQFITIHNVEVDQATSYAIAIVKGTQTTITSCALTDSAAGIQIGTYNGGTGVIVARTDISNCKLQDMETNGIVADAGASQFTITGSRFINMGTGGSGVCVAIANDATLTSDEILIANNDMVHADFGTIDDAAKAGSTDRVYVNNVGVAPTITNTAGTIVTAKTIEYNATSGFKLGVGTVPAKTFEAYQSTAGFPIVARLTNYDNAANSGVALGFDATGGSETRGAKAGFGLERTTTFGRGKLHFLIDNTADTSEIALADSAGHVAPDGGLAWGAAAVSGGIATITATGVLHAVSGTATAAGGALGVKMGTAGVGLYWGSGAPTISAAKSSLYMRTDGSSTSTRLYVNTDGSTAWTNVTTAT